jgi:hypothetical protein
MKNQFARLLVFFIFLFSVFSLPAQAKSNDAKGLIVWAQKYIIPAYKLNMDVLGELTTLMDMLGAFNDKEVSLKYLKSEFPHKMSLIRSNLDNIYTYIKPMKVVEADNIKYAEIRKMIIIKFEDMLKETESIYNHANTLYASAIRGDKLDFDKVQILALKRSQAILKGENSLLIYDIANSSDKSPSKHYSTVILCGNKIMINILELSIFGLQKNISNRQNGLELVSEMKVEIENARKAIQLGIQATNRFKRYYSQKSVIRKEGSVRIKIFRKVIQSFYNSFAIETKIINVVETMLVDIFKAAAAGGDKNKVALNKFEESFNLTRTNLDKLVAERMKEKEARFQLAKALY